MTMALDAAEPPVDMLGLVVLVRIRRVLRLGARLVLLALPGWLVVVLWAVGATDAESPTHLWFTEHGANRGFLVIVVMLAVDLVLARGVRLAGAAGAAAVRLVPLWRAIPDPVLGPQSGPDVGRLLDVGSRNRRVPAPGVARWPTVLLGLALAFLVPVCAGTAVGVRPEYRASHGRGGPVVTVGAHSANVRVDDRNSDDVSYYLALPVGIDLPAGIDRPQREALTDARRLPEPGTRYVIVSRSGGAHGIRIGGSSWLEDLIAAVVLGLIGCVILFFFVRRLLSRVPDERIVPRTTTLGELAGGRTVTVQPVGTSGAGPVLPLAGPRDERGAEEIVRAARNRVRRVTAGLVALLVAAGLVTAFV